jgi:hypothetical protein
LPPTSVTPALIARPSAVIAAAPPTSASLITVGALMAPSPPLPTDPHRSLPSALASHRYWRWSDADVAAGIDRPETICARLVVSVILSATAAATLIESAPPSLVSVLAVLADG